MKKENLLPTAIAVVIVVLWVSAIVWAVKQERASRAARRVAIACAIR